MKILLVEDSRAVAALMVERLAAFGHNVNLAEDGKVAFDKFCASPPDLVLMDIELPVMNGFEVTHRIRSFEAMQKWAWTPIVFLTASDSPENLIMAIEAGADDYLVKGVSEEVLHAKMKAMARIAALRQLLSIANQKLEQQASRDGLTGLFNRRWMDLNLDHAWEEAVSKQTSFAILMLDVDNFKKYNDQYGHQAGDDCLRAVAHAIETVIAQTNAEGLTKGAFPARYGGEEFAVVIPYATLDAYQKCAERILESVRKLAIRHEHNEAWGILTVSMGGSRHKVSSDKVAMLFREADVALYRAKENGRNQVVYAG